MSASASSLSVSATGAGESVLPEERLGAPPLPSTVTKKRFYRSASSFQHMVARPFFLDFHILSSRSHYTYPSHRHDQYELILVREGPYRCLLNRRNVIVQRGQALLIKPGDLHQDTFHPGQVHYVVHFQLHLGGSREAPVVPLFQPSAGIEQQTCRTNLTGDFDLVEQIAHEAHQSHAYASSIQDALLEVLFWRVVRSLPSSGLSQHFQRFSSDQNFLSRLYDLFQSSAVSPLPVTAMAARLGVSARTFHHRVNRLLGASPKSAFDRFRIERARELLKDPGLTVKEVSFRLGFANPCHFSRVFKKIAGVPPGQCPRC